VHDDHDVSKRNRIFIGILLAFTLGVAVLLWRLLADIDPRYRESAEESQPLQPPVQRQHLRLREDARGAARGGGGCARPVAV
jgi:hypothetical protein